MRVFIFLKYSLKKVYKYFKFWLVTNQNLHLCVEKTGSGFMIIMKYTYTYTGYTAVTKLDKYKDIHIIRLSIFY